MIAIPATPFYPIKQGPQNFPEEGWLQMVSLYKKLQRFLPLIRQSMTDEKKKAMYDNCTMFVGQITNKPPTYQDSALDVYYQSIALRTTYPAIYDLLQFTMCRDVVQYESIKFIPPRTGWTQIKKNRIARFVKNRDTRSKPAPSAKSQPPPRGAPGPRPRTNHGPQPKPRPALAPAREPIMVLS